MTTPCIDSLVPRTFAAWLIIFAALLGSAAVSPLRAADSRHPATFDVPADSAENALKQFSAQSGAPVALADPAAGRVRTNAVKGDYAPREALERMLAGTGLAAEQDAATGALRVIRASGDWSGVKSTTGTDSKDYALVKLSPFEVDGSNQRGYYAANTMSGTRLNSNIADLASSITVVTKEQMSDFAMLDINDIFKYEASTEGTGNYTSININASGVPEDNTAFDPNNANRIRGIGPSNVSFGNFITSNRVPIDPLAIDGVEISRGPNSSIFGLGNPAGTVNLVPSSANLVRNKAQTQARVDSYGGHRNTVDVNQVLVPGVLAIRGSAVYQHTGYNLKPSGTDTIRLNGMVKYQPLKSTTITASYSYYEMQGNQPNTTTPRDGVTPWINAGSPTWDPLTSTQFLNGVSTVYTTLPTNSALKTLRQGSGRGESQLFIDQGGSIGLWTPGFANSGTAPAIGSPTYFYTQSAPSNLRSTQPLFATDPAVSNKAIYDWSSINLAAMNSIRQLTGTTMVQVEQTFFDTPTQTLAAQVGWFREDSRNQDRDFYGRPSGNAVTNFLEIDTNTRLLTGAPNPYFLRPYISLTDFTQDDLPLLYNTYRAELAYKLDLTHQKSWLRWLGRHNLLGYAEYHDFTTWTDLSREAVLDNHTWAPAGDPRGVTGANVAYQNYYHFYVGDNKGYNVDYAPSDFRPGIYPYTWGNPPNQIVENAQLGLAPESSTAAETIQKTKGVVLQSFTARDRLVTTFGLRDDQEDSRSTSAAGIVTSGRTSTAGAVLKALPWLSLYANVSDSFIPSPLAQDLNGKIVPNPTGKGLDYGVTFNLIAGKLNVKLNHYRMKQLNSRVGTSSSIASTIRVLDIDDGSAARGFGLDYRAPIWIKDTFIKNGINPTQDQINARLAQVMQMDPVRMQSLERANAGGANGQSMLPIAEPSDLTADGDEIEINYNPTIYWTVKCNLTQQETINGQLAPNIDAYLAARLPVWQSIIDEDTGLPWFTSRYDGTTTTPQSYLVGTVEPRIPVAEALQGKSSPEVRKYRVNLTQSFRLAGLGDWRVLRHFTVGASTRWEDKGGIGYYGVQQLPSIITALDPNRPVYDKGHVYVDLFTAYRTRLWADKIGLTVQLNVVNVQEGGRLQPVSAFPDGTANAYRIIDPRQFILSATFDL